MSTSSSTSAPPSPASPAADLTAESLRQFTGSSGLYFDPIFRSIRYTDGIHHLRANGLNWLVVDVLAQLPPLLAKEDFICIVLRMDGDRGVLSFSDGNGNVLRPVHKYIYADCPLPELKLFCTDGVLMLPSER